MKVTTPGGEIVDLGITETTPTIGIIDYSRRVTDDFGVTTVVERGFARRLSVRFALPFANVDAVQRRLADLRASPALWVADNRFASLAVRGFYKDFDLDLNVPPLSYCTLTVEGLTVTEPLTDSGADPAPSGKLSSLRLLQPVEVVGSILTSSTVPETDYPEWSSGSSYVVGARVIRAATHRIYESLLDANAGHDPAGAGAAQWLDVGPTNRWAMLDQALGTATRAAGSFSVTLDGDGINAVALLDVSATTVRVQAAGYDRTLPTGPGAILFLDLPPTDGAILVTVTGTGEVSAGTLLIGHLVGLGTTEASPTASITDFSRKETDEFGEVSVVPRAWAKRMTTNALINTSAVDDVVSRIVAVRARPSLWIGQAGIDSLTVYGFFKDFSIEVGDSVSKLSLSVEGLSTAAKVAPLLASVEWEDVKDTGGKKPDDNATYGAPGSSPVGSSTASAIVANVAALQAQIDSIIVAGGSDAAGAAAAASAAAAARDAAIVARDTANTAATQSAAARDAATAAQALAIDAKNLAASSAAAATGSASSAAGSASTAASKATDAGLSASSASGYANTATTQAGLAAGSAAGASTSASGAASSSTSAGNSASAANSARVAAEAARDAASGSAGASAGSASTAAGSATAAGNSASAANTSAANAATSAGQANSYAGNASSSATAAATSATNASGSANTAATQATNAANSAGTSGLSATAASASASVATTQAGNAAASASSAHSYSDLAAVQAGNASTSAGSASSSAAAATASAAAARQSATLSASVGPGILNRNPTFSEWPGGTGTLPTYWGDWASGNEAIQAAGINGNPFRLQFNAPANRDTGTVQSFSAGFVKAIFEVTAEMDTAQGAGCLIYGLSANGGEIIFSRPLNFATDPDNAGWVSAPGTGGGGNFRRTWSIFCDTPVNGNIVLWNVYLFANWSAFGARPAKTILFHSARFRPASDGEIAGKRADGNASAALAQISSNASVQASVNAAQAATNATLTAQLAGTGPSSLKATIDSNAAAAATATAAVASRSTVLEAAVRAGSANLVVNGDFKNGFRGWAVGPGWGAANYPTVGTYAQHIAGSGGTFPTFLYQDVPVAAGVAYSVSYEGNQYNGGDAHVYAQWLDAGRNVISNHTAALPRGGWGQGNGPGGRWVSNPVAAPAGAAFLRCVIYAGDATAAFDSTRYMVQEGPPTAWRDDGSLVDAVARLTTSEGVYADHAGKLGAFWQVTAVAGGRAQMTVYADANGGGGVDITGDLNLTGNARITGIVRANAFVTDQGVNLQAVVPGALSSVVAANQVGFRSVASGSAAELCRTGALGITSGDDYVTIRYGYIIGSVSPYFDNYIQLERSMDGVNWTALDQHQVLSSGNFDYYLEDGAHPVGNASYRIAVYSSANGGFSTNGANIRVRRFAVKS